MFASAGRPFRDWRCFTSAPHQIVPSLFRPSFFTQTRICAFAPRVVRGRAWAAALLCGSSALACAGDGHGVVDPLNGDPARFTWLLPSGFVAPPVPVDNPMSAAKVELGRRLFYDTRLSGNGTLSCASCHRQEFAFADARNVPLGSTGEPHPRNSIGLSNAGYQLSFGWANPDTRVLERQALIPMFGLHPVELGLGGREAELLQRLRDVAIYRDLFARSFPADTDPIALDNLTKALATFQRTIISGSSPYDRFVRGQRNAISLSAQRGESLFRSARLHCAECHRGTLLTNAAESGELSTPSVLPEFFNNGLYNVDGRGAYPSNNVGLFEHTSLPADMGRFKVPSLRNVALTFPYMHDGTVGSLEDVIDHYTRGGRAVAVGPNAGDGSLSPVKDPRIAGFSITSQEKTDLIAFLRSLTDSSVVLNPRFSNPWVKGR